MPRSTIADRVERIFDKDLMLRDYAAAALSATGSSTAINFEVRKQKLYKVTLNIAAYTGTFAAGTLQWRISVEVSDLVGGTFTEVGGFVPTGVATQVDIPLSRVLINTLDDDADWIRVTATKTGAPGNLTYGAFLTKG